MLACAGVVAALKRRGVQVGMSIGEGKGRQGHRGQGPAERPALAAPRGQGQGLAPLSIPGGAGADSAAGA